MIADDKLINEDDPRLIFVAIQEAAIPPVGLIEHLKDKWWITHPTKGIVYWAILGGAKRRVISLHPLCNSNQEVTKRLSIPYPWAEIKFLPSVFRNINPNDYV